MENSIFIKNLPKDVFVPELCDNFRCFGEILSATVHCEGPVNEAYIEFDKNFSALTAVKSMNNKMIKNKPIQVILSFEKNHFKKVFVKNFNPKWDECDLLKAFEEIGTIDKIEISQGNGKSNGYGFLVFKNHFTAKRAIEYGNGKEIDGYQLIVDRFKSKSERDNLKKNSLEYVEKMLLKSVQLNNLYVKNLPRDMKEDQLKKLFEPFGAIISVKIAVDENDVSKGFGFACFRNKQDARKAMERMNDYPLKGKKLQISFKEDGQLRRQYITLKNKEKEIKIKQYKQRAQSVPRLVPHPLYFK